MAAMSSGVPSGVGTLLSPRALEGCVGHGTLETATRPANTTYPLKGTVVTRTTRAAARKNKWLAGSRFMVNLRSQPRPRFVGHPDATVRPLMFKGRWDKPWDVYVGKPCVAWGFRFEPTDQWAAVPVVPTRPARKGQPAEGHRPMTIEEFRVYLLFEISARAEAARWVASIFQKRIACWCIGSHCHSTCHAHVLLEAASALHGFYAPRVSYQQYANALCGSEDEEV